MSWFTFLASDFELEDVINPHIKYYSVNEALAVGIDVPDLVLNSVNIDRNKPDVLLWIDDEKNTVEIIIYAIEKDSFINGFTSLKHCAVMEWDYSRERGLKLIQYINKHLEIADKVEIWTVWDGNIDKHPTEKTFYMKAKDLTPHDFDKMTQYDSQCIVITRN